MLAPPQQPDILRTGALLLVLLLLLLLLCVRCEGVGGGGVGGGAVQCKAQAPLERERGTYSPPVEVARELHTARTAQHARELCAKNTHQRWPRRWALWARARICSVVLLCE